MGHLLQVRLLPNGAKIEKLYKYKKRVLVEKGVTKPVKQLKENMKQKHEERINKLAKSGIEFKWWSGSLIAQPFPGNSVL